MSISLDSKFHYPPERLQAAVDFPDGSYIEVDDPVFLANGLGRMVVQTQRFEIGGRQVSLGYLPVDGTNYELIGSDMNPIELGSFDMIIRSYSAYFDALHRAFGGHSSYYSHLEMVVSITKALRDGTTASDELRMRSTASWARTYAKRAAWIMCNRLSAAMDTPVEWSGIGL